MSLADPRQPGEALWPSRYDLRFLQSSKASMGSYAFSALYQGRPAPPEGALIKRGWFQFYVEPPDRFDDLLQSWDMTFKDSDGTDFVVGQVWGKIGVRKYLLDQVRARMDFTATVRAVVALTAKWQACATAHGRGEYAKLVEDKANGPAIVSVLRDQVPSIREEPVDGNKVARASACAPTIEAGNVYLPDPITAPWVSDLLLEVDMFPKGAHDDQIDALTQALNHWARVGGVEAWMGYAALLAQQPLPTPTAGDRRRAPTPSVALPDGVPDLMAIYRSVGGGTAPDPQTTCHACGQALGDTVTEQGTDRYHPACFR